MIIEIYQRRIDVQYLDHRSITALSYGLMLLFLKINALILHSRCEIGISSLSLTLLALMPLVNLLNQGFCQQKEP